jgi:hypothetical protein
MNGSDKQIEWAESIITEWDASFDHIIAEAKARVERNTMPANWISHVTAVVEQAKTRIATLTKASDVIDMKKRSNVPALVKQQTIATWNA